MSEKTFPIQEYGRVPWEVAEQAYIGYAKQCGTSQSLERLGERGGFGVEEMDEFYPEWRSTARLIKELTESVANWSKQGLEMAEKFGELQAEHEAVQQENIRLRDCALANERHAALYKEDQAQEEIAIRSGPHLGAVRRWIKWNCPNGDRVIWGTDTSLGKFTVRQLEELAQRIADEAELHDEELGKTLKFLKSKLESVRGESDCYEQAYIKAERGRIRLGGQAKEWKTAHKHLWRFVEEVKFEDDEMSAGLYLEAEEAYAGAIRVEKDALKQKEAEGSE
jgi:hypothetical protein